MIVIDERSHVPIYAQIKNQVMHLIQAGVYTADDRLPSIRELSRELGLNVNTVKKAFSDLEADGVIYSVVGRGSFVSADAFSNKRIRENAMKEIRISLEACKAQGVTREDLELLLDELYRER